MNRRLLSIFIAVIFLSGIVQAQNSTEAKAEFNAQAKVDILNGVKEILSKRAFVPGIEFSQWDAFVAKHQESFDTAKTESEFASAVNRAIREFGISHVGLQAPSSAQIRRTGRRGGLGLTTKFTEEGLQVTAVDSDSSASKAGLLVGDMILEVNGEKPVEATRLSSREGLPMTLLVKNSGGRTRTVAIVVGTVSIARVDTLTWIDDKSAVLKLDSFSRGYDRENLEKLITEAGNAENLLIDLRNNGGGSVSNLSHFLGLFLPSESEVGTFINQRSFDRYVEEMKVESPTLVEIAAWNTSKFKARKPTIQPFQGKIAVLVNRRSASASEIFASALKEVRGATIVGSKTRGAVLASTFGRLPNGFEIQYPVSDYVTLKGVRLEGNPWSPDIEVTSTELVDNVDPCISAALEALSKLPISIEKWAS